MRTLIVYYSLEGNTAFAAEKIAGAMGAAPLRLEPEKEYPDSGMKKFLWGGKSAVMGDKPKLRPYRFDGSCDAVVLGTPVWASSFTPPLRTFIEENRDALKGKRLAVFVCYSGGGADKAIEKLRRFLAAESFAAELILIDPKDKPSDDNESMIKAFCEKLR